MTQEKISTQMVNDLIKIGYNTLKTDFEGQNILIQEEYLHLITELEKRVIRLDQRIKLIEEWIVEEDC